MLKNLTTKIKEIGMAIKKHSVITNEVEQLNSGEKDLFIKIALHKNPEKLTKAELIALSGQKERAVEIKIASLKEKGFIAVIKEKKNVVGYKILKGI